MKKLFNYGLVAIAFIVAFNSCTKEDSVEPSATKSTIMAAADTGEVVSLNTTVYTVVNDNYLLNTPLDHNSYDIVNQTVCNKELLIKFNLPGGLSYDYINSNNPYLKWGVKPYVVDEYTSTLVFEFAGPVLILKLSKKVKEFGMEYNTPYYGDNRFDVIQSIWDKKKKTKIAQGRTIRLNAVLPGTIERFGGSAVLMAMKSTIPFDEVRITISDSTGAPVTYPIINHIISGIRYTLAE
jgi:hypothetical protein